MDHAERPRLTRFQPTAKRRQWLHPAFHDPVRLTQLVAGVMLVLGSFAGWLEVWLPYRGWFEYSAFAGSGDGGITFEVGLVLLAIAWSERASGSRLVVLVLGPLVLGVVALLVLRVASDSLTTYLQVTIEPSGGRGYLLPGFWMTVAGATLAILAGTVRLWRVRREVRWTIGIPRASVGAIIGGLAGAGIGFISGITVGQRITTGGLGGVQGSVLILFAIGFAFAGTWLGAWAGGLLASSTERT
jgi:hypothetical protein